MQLKYTWNEGRIKHQIYISQTNHWTLPASGERNCQSVVISSRLLYCSSCRNQELSSQTFLFREPPLSLLQQRVTQTVSGLVYVCVLHGWREVVRENTGPLYSHYTLNTHPSPEGGNLSSLCDVTSCAQPWMWACAEGVWMGIGGAPTNLQFLLQSERSSLVAMAPLQRDINSLSMSSWQLW